MESGIFALVIHLVYNTHMNLAQKMKVVVLFGTRAMSVPINNLNRVSIRLADVLTRVVIFAALRISYLPSCFYSQDPTYSGIPAAIYALAEMHASLITATTPLLKSLILKFNVIGQKPTLIIATKRYGSGTDTKHTKTELTSKSTSNDGQSNQAQHGDRIQGSNAVTN